MFASTANINLKISLKHYSLKLDQLYRQYSSINYQQSQDWKDLKNASIKELSISYSEFIFIGKYKQNLNLIELLRNTNIKKIVLVFDINPSIDFLFFISKLIRKNTTIKEIKIYIHFYISSIKEFVKHAWFYFIDTISNRLVKLKFADNIGDFHSNLDSLLLRNSNLKEIEIINNDNDDVVYTEMIKDVLSSEKYLDDFRIIAKKGFNNQFYDSISKIKAKAQIDTLYIDSTYTDDCLASIENAYLFKIKTIKILFLYELNVFNTVFKLSNNPHNTVKSIIIDKSKKNLDEIKSEIKSFNLKDYNLKKLPKIYLHGYQELILDEIDDEHSLFKKSKMDTTRFFFILKRNSIEVNNLTELLYILFNSPIKLSRLYVQYDENDMTLKYTNPQYLVENRKSIILGMMATFDKFKVDKILPKRNEIRWIDFDFKKKSPEFNFVYFTVLE